MQEHPIKYQSEQRFRDLKRGSSQVGQPPLWFMRLVPKFLSLHLILVQAHERGLESSGVGATQSSTVATTS